MRPTGRARSAGAPAPKNARRTEGGRGPTLLWPGRTWTRASADPTPVAPPLMEEERFGDAGKNQLIRGDSLDVARALLERGLRGRVDLVYVDPPFASQASYTHEVRLDGPADGRVTRTRAYDDSWPSRRGETLDEKDGISAYLDMLAPRLEAMAALLATTGTLWVHLDWRAAYLVRVLLDEILGRDAFLNEVVWRRAPNLGRQATSGQFGRTLDTLVVYGGADARLTPPTRLEPVPAPGIRRDEEGRPFTTAPRGDYTDASMRRLASEGRVHTTSSGRQYIKYFLEPNADGDLCRERRIDTLWTDIAPLRHTGLSERTGYPTQKPRALLERVIRCATPEGGTVVDLFAGSGTTGDVAHAVGRRFIMADQSPVAINTARARLLRANAPFEVLSCGERAAGPAADVSVTVRLDQGGECTLKLERPTEPLGWAIGERSVKEDGSKGAFVATWHAERRLGSVPVPAALRAPVTPAGDAAIEVRVYGDDGSVGTAEVTRVASS